MKVERKTLLKSLNKTFRKEHVNRVDFDIFKAELQKLLSKVDENESEEHLKYPLRDFLLNTSFVQNEINTKGRTDLAIYSGNSNKTPVNVIFEVKKPKSKDFPTATDINCKAVHEAVLYYIRERYEEKNDEIKHIIITNIYEWYVFDAHDFESVFYTAKGHASLSEKGENNATYPLVQEYEKWKSGQKTSKSTEHFYKIVKQYIENTDSKIQVTHFDLRSYEKILPENEKVLVPLVKILSATHLLKLNYITDSNSLNYQFYNELLYIIGLTEVKSGTKKIIQRVSEKQRVSGSLIENAIGTIKTENRLSKIDGLHRFGNTEDEQVFNIALELAITWINRILFLKLLEAQLVSFHKKDKSYKFLEASVIANFGELNELFFDILAKEVHEREKFIKKELKNIPYLNSSLFEISKLEDGLIRINSLKDRLTMPVYSHSVLKEKRSTNLPTLNYLFEFLDAYNFSNEGADEIQEENKSLINASVLGLIFEKINGYQEGSFFTPGYITMYMSRETIRRAVVQKFKDTNLLKFKSLEKFDDLKELIDDRKEANTIINSLKIIDPAVGSGHFLVSALNELIAIKSELNILCYKSGRRILDFKAEVVNDDLVITNHETEEIFEYVLNKKGNTIPYKQDLQEAIFNEKQTIIENCLFGVDINSNSVNICRLRLWIELLKHTYYKPIASLPKLELETLPNIDINIKQGNSLISNFAINGNGLQNGISQKVKLATQKYKEQVIIYKSTNNKEVKKNTEKKISEIKEMFSNVVRPLDNDYKLLKEKEAKLGELPIFFTIQEKETWEKQRAELQSEIEALKKNLEHKRKTIYKNVFEWRFEFPEALDENGNFEGFDVVLGNPPYIEHKQLQLFSSYFKENYQLYSGTADISVYFFELALNILKKEKIFSYITTNKFFRTEYGKNLRNLLTQNQLLQIVDFEQVSIFDEALVSSSIIIGKKSKPQTNFAYSKFEKEKPDYKNLTNEITNRKIIFNPKKINSRAWKFISPEKEKIITKIETTGKPIKDYKTIQIRRGVTTGYDKAFIINTKKRNELVKKDAKNKKIIKSLLKGKDIKKYYSKYDDLWLIFTRKNTLDINKFQVLKSFLLNYKADLQPRNDINKKGRKPGMYKWFEIQDNTAYYQMFDKQKIIWALTADKWGFCLDNEKYFLTSGAFFLISEEIPVKYILAVLNSKLMQFYFSAIGVMTAGGAYTLKKTTIERFTLPKPNKKAIDNVIKKIDEIIKIKQTDVKNDIRKLETQIDKIVYKLYGLTKSEITEIEAFYK